MSKRFVSRVLLCMCVVLPCNAGAWAAEASRVIKIKDCEKIKYLPYTNKKFFESYKMVKLEANRDCMIGRVSQLILFEDKIYILDEVADVLLVFNMDGTFSHRIGVKGRGPQEYLALNAFYINPEKREITIFDPLTCQGQTFDLAGKFIGTKKVSQNVKVSSFSHMKYIGNDKVVCYANLNGFTEDMLFVLDDNDMSVVDKLSKRPIKVPQMSFSAVAQSYSLVGSKLHFVKLFDNKIYAYDKGTVAPVVEIDTGKPLVPSNVLKATAESNEGDYFKTARQLSGKYSVGLKNLYETSRFIFCELQYDSFSNGFLIWDKSSMRGIFVEGSSSLVPGLRDILYSSDDNLVGCWSMLSIDYYQRQLKEGRINKSEFTDDVAAVLESYEPTEDNPLLFIYDIKK